MQQPRRLLTLAIGADEREPHPTERPAGAAFRGEDHLVVAPLLELVAAVMSTSELAETIDKSVFPGLQGGPLDHVIAAKAVAFHEAAQPEFKEYAAQIVRNADALARALGEHGLRLVSGGTDNHLMLVDLRTFDADLSGKKARLALDQAGISLNENTVPDDPRPPYITSGLRIGTPATTTQGMKETEMATIGALIHRVLVGREDEAEWPPSATRSSRSAPASPRTRDRMLVHRGPYRGHGDPEFERGGVTRRTPSSSSSRS